jgi:hypothetical protein
MVRTHLTTPILPTLVLSYGVLIPAEEEWGITPFEDVVWEGERRCSVFGVGMRPPLDIFSRPIGSRGSRSLSIQLPHGAPR